MIVTLAAVIIAFAMYMPLAAFAEDLPQDADAKAEKSRTENAAVDFKAADDTQWGYANKDKGVIWTLDDEGTLTFTVAESASTDAEKAIRQLLKSDGTTSAKADLQSVTRKIVVRKEVTGIGWTALYDKPYTKQPPYDPDIYQYNRPETGVFQEFNALTEVEVESGSAVQRIGWSAFRKCYNLKTFNFDALVNMVEIMDQAFSPSGLETVDLTKCTKLETIRYAAFGGSGANSQQHPISDVKFPESIRTIGGSAFVQCKNLKYISFKDISSVENIYSQAFAGQSRTVLNPIEYVADEKTRQKAVLRQAAKDIFTNVSSLPDNIFDYTALDKYEPDLYWQLTLNVKEKTAIYNGNEQYGYTVSDVTGSGDDTCTVSGLQDGHVLSVIYDDPAGPSHGTDAAEYDNGTFENAGYTMMYEGYNYAVNYQVSAAPGKLRINRLPKLTVEVTGRNDTKVYNATEQSVSGYDWKAADPDGVTYTEDDFTFTGSDTAARKTVGRTGMGLAPDQFVNNNTNIEEVEFVVNDGYMTITAADLTITARDQSYAYNGHPQGPAGTYSEDFDTYVRVSGLQGSDALTRITLSGSGTNAGKYDGRIVPGAAQVGSATGNYKVSYLNGRLTITPIDVTVKIIGHEDAGVYNGRQQSVSGYDFSADTNLYTRSDFEFTGSDTAARKDVGTTRMGLADSQFRNTSGNFGSVTFIVTDGSIRVTGRSLTITTGSASKKYDGKALTNSRYSVSGLASGDTITVKTTGSRTDVGSSRNTCTISWGATKKSNYDITEQLGTLTVEKADDPDDPDDNGGGNGGNGGNANGNANGNTPAAAAAPAGAATPGANIPDAPTPLTDGETIEDGPVPKAVPEDGGHWALLNLILTLLTILLAALLALWDKLADEADGSIRARRIIGAALAVLAVIILILTEDFTEPMRFIDRWTALMALIFILETCAALLMKVVRRSEADE